MIFLNHRSQFILSIRPVYKEYYFEMIERGVRHFFPHFIYIERDGTSRSCQDVHFVSLEKRALGLTFTFIRTIRHPDDLR